VYGVRTLYVVQYGRRTQCKATTNSLASWSIFFLSFFLSIHYNTPLFITAMNSSSNRNIVKISEFCKRSGHCRRRRRRQGGIVHHHDGVSAAQQENSTCAPNGQEEALLDDSIMSIPFERLEDVIQSSPWHSTDGDGDNMLIQETIVNVSIMKSFPDGDIPKIDKEEVTSSSSSSSSSSSNNNKTSQSIFN